MGTYKITREVSDWCYEFEKVNFPNKHGITQEFVLQNIVKHDCGGGNGWIILSIKPSPVNAGWWVVHLVNRKTNKGWLREYDLLSIMKKMESDGVF